MTSLYMRVHFRSARNPSVHSHADYALTAPLNELKESDLSDAMADAILDYMDGSYATVHGPMGEKLGTFGKECSPGTHSLFDPCPLDCTSELDIHSEVFYD